jgi:RNA polymerase sigma-70 factor (TIGR02960 family)
MHDRANSIHDSEVGPEVTAFKSEFETLTDPFRRELLAHCYRMLGSIQDAEDLVQETYLRAWRSFEQFEGRSSLRVWLYKIATMACLSALESRRRRPLPSHLGPASRDSRQGIAANELDVPWLQPAPDALIAPMSSDPSFIAESRASIRLAFIAALQNLSARQRAVLILRDVLDMRANEVADILDTSTIAVNSALRRAREQLRLSDSTDSELLEPIESQLRDLLDRYVDAFERADFGALVQLLRLDVELEMPPTPTWFTGREAVMGFFTSNVLSHPDTWRIFPTRANGQAAVVAYGKQGDEQYHAHGVHVLTFIGERISRITAFNDEDLIPHFRMVSILGESNKGTSSELGDGWGR